MLPASTRNLLYSWIKGLKCLTDVIGVERCLYTATNEDSIRAVRLIIETDKRVTCQQNWPSFGIEVFKAKAAWFESAAGFTNSENKYRLRARYDDFPEYQTQSIEAYEVFLEILDDSKPKHEAVLTKGFTRALLRVSELSSVNGLFYFGDLKFTKRCGSKVKVGDGLPRPYPDGYQVIEEIRISGWRVVSRSRIWSYRLFHIARGKLPIELKTRFKQRPSSAVNFDQLVKFLKEKFRLLDNIPRDVRESRGIEGCWETPDQRSGDSGRRIGTPPPSL
ncbi:hypothetical protein EVAR_56862_1 [Eumeta japonica]|uniref:Uncharacterized protein n=1 Tax=Eumeta variegata TaxID=151549 RepID=A0A4C1YU60_EUMVA|nr:hypothetical protein EVAR_56862_1 [Eumeta japonica]